MKKLDWRSFSNKDYIFKDFPRLPTGIFEVDYALGGGFPIGVTSNIFGVDHSFKTGLLFKLVASGLSFCWRCYNYEWDCVCDQTTKKAVIFVDLEVADWEWAEQVGVKINDPNFYLIEPEYGEEAVDVIYEALKDQEVGLVVVDSITRILPREEVVVPAGDFKVGLRAKLQTQLINKVKSALIYRKKIKDPAMFVATTQIRANIGAYFGENVESSAPYALKHDWHLSVKTSKLTPKSEGEESEVPNVGRFKLTISSLKTKRKMFVLAGECEYKISLDPTTGLGAGQPIDINTFINYAKNYMDDNWSLFNYSFKTRKEMVEFFTNNEKEYLTIKQKLIRKFVEDRKENFRNAKSYM